MAHLRERHEIVAETEDRTFVFLAEAEKGRLTIREVDPDGEEEICAITLSEADELEGFFGGLRRVLEAAGLSRQVQPPHPAPPAEKSLSEGPSSPGDSPAGPRDASPSEDREEMVENARRRNRRAFSPWTPDEEREVENRFRAGESLEAIARSRGRSRRAIEMRLEKLGVLEADRG